MLCLHQVQLCTNEDDYHPNWIRSTELNCTFIHSAAKEAPSRSDSRDRGGECSFCVSLSGRICQFVFWSWVCEFWGLKRVVVAEMDEVGNDLSAGAEGFVLESASPMTEEMAEEAAAEESALAVAGEGGAMESGAGVADGVGSGTVFVF